MSTPSDATWWWCLKHSRAESPPDVKQDLRLGPYATKDAAEHWRDTVDARNEAWDKDDERWEQGRTSS